MVKKFQMVVLETHLADERVHQRGFDLGLVESYDAHARRIQPSDLMTRPFPGMFNQTRMPKYIHQSWKAKELSENMSRWSLTCRLMHPDWEWVLWTDEDNLAMTRKFFPWFLQTYLDLPEEISRADAARNMYMYLFGGMYADLDTECVKDMTTLFQSRGTALSGDPDADVAGTLITGFSLPAAFLGRMDYDMTDNTLMHVIPNAWMASTPGHPFWLFVLENLRSQLQTKSRSELANVDIEEITGPVALHQNLQLYEAFIDRGVDWGRIFANNSSWQLFERDSAARVVSKINLLPPKTIYPYAWNNAGRWYREICWSIRKGFNAKKCKESVLTSQSYAIAYWSHTWATN